MRRLATTVLACVFVVAACSFTSGSVRLAPPRSLMILLDETTEAGSDARGLPSKTERTEYLSAGVSRALLMEGWNLNLPPAGSTPQSLSDAFQVAKMSNVSALLYGKARFTQHEGMPGADGKPVTFPVSASFDLSLVSARDGALIGMTSGRLTLGQKGEREGEVMGRMVVSYDRTAREIVERRLEDTVLPQLREVLAKHLARLDGGTPP